MMNKVLPKEEIEELKKVISLFDEFMEIHNNNVPDITPEEAREDDEQSILQRMQTLMIISYTKEAFEAVGGIKFFLEADEEKLKEAFTNNGEVSLAEAEKKLLFSKLMESIECESAGSLAELLENILD